MTLDLDNNKEHEEKLKNFYKENLSLETRWEDPAYAYSLRNPIGLYIRQSIERELIGVFNRYGIYLNNRKVLDIGCGSGYWLRFFAEIKGTAKDLVGIDLLAHRIAKAKEVNSGLDLKVASATNLPFPGNHFDFISQFDAFEHLLDNLSLKKAAEEVSRVLKKDGYFLWFELLPFENTASDLSRGYSFKEVQELFSKFEIIYFKYMFKTFNIFSKKIDTIYKLPKYSFALTDLTQKIPFGKHSNLLIIMRKK